MKQRANVGGGSASGRGSSASVLSHCDRRARELDRCNENRDPCPLDEGMGRGLADPWQDSLRGLGRRKEPTTIRAIRPTDSRSSIYTRVDTCHAIVTCDAADAKHQTKRLLLAIFKLHRMIMYSYFIASDRDRNRNQRRDAARRKRC